MEGAVEDEFHQETAVVKGIGTLLEIDRSVVQKIAEDAESFAPKPDGRREHEGESGRVAQEVELIEFSRRRRQSFSLGPCRLVEEFLGKYVLSDEDESCEEGVQDAEELSAKRLVPRTSKHDTDSEGDE